MDRQRVVSHDITSLDGVAYDWRSNHEEFVCLNNRCILKYIKGQIGFILYDIIVYDLTCQKSQILTIKELVCLFEVRNFRGFWNWLLQYDKKKYALNVCDIQALEFISLPKSHTRGMMDSLLKPHHYYQLYLSHNRGRDCTSTLWFIAISL